MAEETDITTQPLEVISAVLDWAIKCFTEQGTRLGVDIASVDLDGFVAGTKPTAALYSVPSNPVIKTYKSGQAILKYDFALMLRVPHTDNLDRINACNLLNSLGSELSNGNLPTIASAEITSAKQNTYAVKINAEDSGADIYQSLFSITYKTN